MKLKPVIFIAAGFGLLWAARGVGTIGDAAPLVPGGVSSERLTYHLTALIMTAGALGLFIAALVMLVRGWRR